MIVLGIHDGHDAGACLMIDGKVVAISSEERRLNKKNLAKALVSGIQHPWRFSIDKELWIR